MPVKLTKKALSDIRVEERKKMREKHKHHKFMQRTLQMYNNDKHRAKEKGMTVPYSLEEFREKAREALEKGICPYGDGSLTIANMAADHSLPLSRGGDFRLDNIVFCTKKSNWRKGSLTEDEYGKLRLFVTCKFEAEAREDIWRRLHIGGKFLPGR